MWAIDKTRRWLGSLAVLAVLLVFAQPARADGEVHVTVIAVLATDRHDKVDPRLKCLAEKMKELDPSLTGFSLGRMTCKSMSVGSEEPFELVDGKSATVLIEHRTKKGKGICVTVKTPGVGALTYTITCDKCFPLATPYQTQKGDYLIVGFMVGPCKGKDNDKKPKP